MLTAPPRSKPSCETARGCRLKPLPMVRLQVRRTVIEWREEKEAATEIEARLDRNGFDAIDINTEVFVQALELFPMFDQLMHSAQYRRIGVLREISIRREFARRVRRVMPHGGAHFYFRQMNYG